MYIIFWLEGPLKYSRSQRWGRWEVTAKAKVWAHQSVIPELHLVWDSHGRAAELTLDESYVGVQIPSAPGRECGVWSRRQWLMRFPLPSYSLCLPSSIFSNASQCPVGRGTQWEACYSESREWQIHPWTHDLIANMCTHDSAQMKWIAIKPPSSQSLL